MRCPRLTTAILRWTVCGLLITVGLWSSGCVSMKHRAGQASEWAGSKFERGGCQTASCEGSACETDVCETNACETEVCESAPCQSGCEPGCQSGCKTGGCRSGGCEIIPGSPEWWAAEGCQPPGVRQKMHHGKMYPVSPRPCGKPQQFSHKFHSVHYWPHPYVCQDRASVREFIDSQARNGWEEATTLYEYHFNAETNELTKNGLNHLKWILMHVPPQHQVVFVQKGFDAHINQARMDQVQNRLVAIADVGHVPSVHYRLTTPTGRPAEEVDSIRRADLSVVPSPRILPQNATTVNTNAAAGGGAPPTP